VRHVSDSALMAPAQRSKAVARTRLTKAQALVRSQAGSRQVAPKRTAETRGHRCGKAMANWKNVASDTILRFQEEECDASRDAATGSLRAFIRQRVEHGKKMHSQTDPVENALKTLLASLLTGVPAARISRSRRRPGKPNSSRESTPEAQGGTQVTLQSQAIRIQIVKQFRTSVPSSQNSIQELMPLPVGCVCALGGNYGRRTEQAQRDMTEYNAPMRP